MSYLSGCATSRYQHKDDFTPQPITDIEALKEPTPVAEPRSTMGNPAKYKVRGKEYSVMKDATDYHDSGTASWYGMKFHGHQTSNGEIFDVYKFSAAHKTLPLPCYVKVTREDNGKSVVVRVNDRGPFHEDRIIDLSYAAAVKLGMHKQGTVKVRIDVIQAPLSGSVRWIQVSALSDANAAEKQRQELENLVDKRWPVTITSRESGNRMIHRVRIGPIAEGADLDAVLDTLKTANIQQPLLLARHQL
ncbi:septal ring lytic transglycosylase RlpA family protein [Thalassolituus sp.]|jgi:rare lipoprotein A|uniref:septal ring lytic transglycosylase RlpA family protein n=1 Tax=Thalassolituus sp. TaxID=2030822 RepID=UPI002A83CDBB|nr:septal ring lytic transglycosylase RlpA family protein [Thalassolituus sp.]